MSTLPISNVPLNAMEIGYLMPEVWDRAKQGEKLAQRIYLKLKAAAIANGVEWYYADPFDVSQPP